MVIGQDNIIKEILAERSKIIFPPLDIKLGLEMIQRFLGNFKDENYNDLVQNCLNSLHNLGCNMSIKVHFLFSHISDSFLISCDHTVQK